MKRRIHTKKVLAAAIGVATVSYAIACGTTDTASSGNLLPPPDANTDTNPADTSTGDSNSSDVVTSGNLLPPPDTGTPDDASADTGTPDDASADTKIDVSTSGNLLPPPDASND